MMNDFWVALASTAYWQAILIVTTALLTTFFGQYFTNRATDKVKLREAKSTYRRLVQQFGQVMHSRFLDEIHNNMYRVRFLDMKTTDPEMRTAYIEQSRVTVDRIHGEALSLSKAYGEIFEELTKIELLVNERDVKQIEAKTATFPDLRHFQIRHLDPQITEEGIERYMTNETRRMQRTIESTLKPMNELYDIMRHMKPRKFL